MWPRCERLRDSDPGFRAGRPWATLSCAPPPSVRAQPCSRNSHNFSCPTDDCCTCFLLLLKLFPLLQPNQSAWWGRWILQISVTCGLYPWGRQLSPPFLFFFIFKRGIFCSTLNYTFCLPSLLRVRTIMVIHWLSFNKKGTMGSTSLDMWSVLETYWTIFRFQTIFSNLYHLLPSPATSAL